MILDSSAILAILYREASFELLADRILGADRVGVGTPTLVEVGILLAGRMGADGRSVLERFLDEFRVEEIPFGELHWRAAVEGSERYGKGRHPAGLNFGDCLSYAVAKVAEDDLLFVGRDFAQTDIPPAI
jgi:ribonuclease VapC